LRRVRREQSLHGVDHAGLRIEYLLKRSSARRSLALKVDAQGRPQINAPLAMPLYRVEDFLIRHVDWLQDQLARRADLVWRTGARVPYLGGEIELVVGAIAGNEPARLEHARLLCPETEIAAAVTAWYRSQARLTLAERLDAECARLGHVTPAWRLSDARTRWGSLSPKGVVGLNWRLIKAGLAEIDYVICHELAHFRHRNHSAAYWREVARICPGFEAARARLLERGPGYMAF
jgi:predicted metal-dependent hydrolase